jgi:hypothetical protein
MIKKQEIHCRKDHGEKEYCNKYWRSFSFSAAIMTTSTPSVLFFFMFMIMARSPKHNFNFLFYKKTFTKTEICILL